jgi:hypothetical protein
VERIRADVEATKREIARVSNAGLPVDEIKAQAQDYVNGLIEYGRPSIQCDHNVAFTVSAPSQGWTGYRSSSLIALLAWFVPQRLLQRLHTEIDADAAAIDKLRLTPNERGTLLSTMSQVLDDLERTEEALIERAADGGTDIPRRPDASPVAILHQGGPQTKGGSSMNLNPAVSNRSAGVVAAGFISFTAGGGQVGECPLTPTVGGQVIFPWRGRQSAEGRVCILAFLALLIIVFLLCWR